MFRWLAILLALSLAVSGVAWATDVDAEALTGVHTSAVTDGAGPDGPETQPCDHCCHGCTHPSALISGTDDRPLASSDGPAWKRDLRFASRSYPPPLQPPAV